VSGHIFEAKVPTPEVYYQNICVGKSDFELYSFSLTFFEGRGQQVEDPDVEDQFVRSCEKLKCIT
jgi:hypothetical protein